MGTAYDWSTTAANNGAADASINFAENQAPSTVNDSARALMARIAALLDMLGGVATYGGSSNAYTITSPTGHAITAYGDGMLFTLTANHTNTGAATVNVDAIGAKAIKTPDGGDVAAGALVSGGRYLLLYDGTNFQVLNAVEALGALVLDSLQIGDDPNIDANSPGGLNFSVTATDLSTSGTKFMSQKVLTVDPPSTSTGDFRASYNRVIADAGAVDVTKIVVGSDYLYHEGSGTLASAFGGNSQVINNDSGTITSGIGDVNYVRQESTGGTFTRGVGSQGIATNVGKTSGVAFTTAIGAYGAVDNQAAGVITLGKAVDGEIIVDAGQVTTGRAVSALVDNAATMTNAYGITSRLDNTGGTLTNWAAVQIFSNIGNAPSGNAYAIRSESTDDSVLDGSLEATKLITGADGLEQDSGGRRRFPRGSLGDDAATSFALNAGVGGWIRLAINAAATGVNLWFDTTGTYELALEDENEAFATIDLTTGALSGTTGADNRITVSIHSDGNFYIENRTGSTITYGVLIYD